jgi:hypothetical protein
MLVVEVLELPERVQEVALIPDERAVQQFVPAGLHPAFHDRVHSRHLDAAQYDLDPGVLEHGVKQAGKLAVAIPDGRGIRRRCLSRRGSLEQRRRAAAAAGIGRAAYGRWACGYVSLPAVAVRWRRGSGCGRGRAVHRPCEQGHPLDLVPLLRPLQQDGVVSSELFSMIRAGSPPRWRRYCALRAERRWHPRRVLMWP